MASETAFQSGWDLGTDLAAHRRERREALEDEARELRVTDLYSKGQALAGHLAKLSDDDPLKAKGMDALASVEDQLREIYHPDKAPGILQKDWHWLSKLVTGKRGQPAQPVMSTTREAGTPEATINLNGQQVTLPSTPGYTSSVKLKPEYMTPEQRSRLANREQAQQRAELDVAAAADLTPEQEAAIATRKSDAEMESRMARFDKYYPDAPKDIRDRYRVGLLDAESGIKTPTVGTKWVTKLGTIDGQKVALMYDERDPEAKLRYMNGTPVPEDLAGKFVPDATKAGQQALKYMKGTNQVLDPLTGKYYNYGDPANPVEVQAMFSGADKMRQIDYEEKVRLAQIRGTAYNASRPMAVYDADTASQQYLPFSQVQAGGGRYMPLTGLDKQQAASNFMEDIKGSSLATREAINNLKEDFPVDMQAKIAAALTADDHGAAYQVLTSQLMGTLSDDQWRFLVRTRQLMEQALSMRSVLNSGQGSDQVRAAIEQTIPSLLTPNRKFALEQLDAFDQTLERLHRVIRPVPLPNQPWSVGPTPVGGAGGVGGPGAAPRTGTAGAGAKGSRSVTDTRNYFLAHPQKSQSTFATPTPTRDQVAQYLQGKGYTPTQ
jgi:hypothetical protein